ncbi:lipoate--protein ligase family protein [Candidimonas nitroreducens]|uniref:Lipoate--protein ligase n=1 Tax=Candidimonas nitroreducens TaxID=683354 RepID=A0A225MAQ1_9BURK|nr:biotin/lipoate A/B protein ligase family protein [Candidimonas nitroreducens]OWT58286.1 lipoate--protein ligase [Candidimonas nitroreducens]
MSGETKRSEWADHDWQLIHDAPQMPLQHMALDQVLLEEVAAGRRAPTLRIWEWAAPAVVIGIFQSLRNEVDAAAAGQLGIQVVRRISGGGAMFIEPGNTITYSIYAPESLVAGMSFRDAYAYMDAFVLEALGELGIKAWYQPLNDITSEGGKIGGAAQARRGGAVLHHVTMAYDIDAVKMLQVLRIGREKLSDKGIQSVAKRVDPLHSQTGLPRETIISRMVDTFRRRNGLSPSALSPTELAAAERLIGEKFGTEAWLAKVP